MGFIFRHYVIFLSLQKQEKNDYECSPQPLKPHKISIGISQNGFGDQCPAQTSGAVRDNIKAGQNRYEKLGLTHNNSSIYAPNLKII